MKIVDGRVYIIGETAAHHDGDYEYLCRMVNEAASLKLSAIKFHINIHPQGHLEKKHPLMKTSRQLMFSKAQWREIIDQANKNKLEVMALANNVKTMRFVVEMYPKVTAVEVHSTGINDVFLLREAAKHKGRVVLGVGGSSVDEIQYALEELKSERKSEVLLMYGFQSYPTNYREINLAKMIKLKQLFGLPIGYADHTAYDDKNNEVVSCMGAVLGCNVLEKHFTLSEGEERLDYHAAVGKKKMKRIMELMKVALATRGNGRLEMSVAEKNYGNVGPMRKALVAKKKIKKGEVITLKKLAFKRTQKESSLKQIDLQRVVGLKAKKNLEEDEIIDFSKVVFKFRKANKSDLIGGVKDGGRK